MSSHFYNLYPISQQLKFIESAENETYLGGRQMQRIFFMPSDDLPSNVSEGALP